MSHPLDRRNFIKTGIAAAAVLSRTHLAGAKQGRKIKKTLKLGMVASQDENKNKLTIKQRLQIAKDAGFDAVEPDTMFDPKEVDEIRKAADEVGIHLDAIICSTHWSSPLSSPDPKVVEKCMEGMKVSLKNAKDMGGDMVLLVPGVVSPEVMYKDAYERSMKAIKELAPIAEDMEITIGLENVWNNFLISPIEFLGFLEEINSPRVKAWFDVGNILRYGFPQDWIRTLGSQIARVDVKDVKITGFMTFDFVPLLKGSVNWPEVMKAFDEIGYEGYFAAEVQGGGMEYLRDVVAQPMDQIIAM
ncbi:MAG: sugar phosphate isomerase/epimerase [Candidatus Omnitrophica bacterium]|nr:sugar phosphate isomerase/epimerase [Candidatus Omnitrophota bacterium]